jgi:ABC-type Zn uptake system ZnuABC Zn-binding protein ZnuA
MSINLKQLKPHHRGMARAQVAFGMKVGQLADKYDMTPQQITNITRSPLYVAEVARLETGADGEVAKLDEELKALAIRAVEIVAEDLMKKDSSEHRTRVAFSILDRTGYSKNILPQDNRKQTITIHNYAPEPGDDPQKAIKDLQELRKVFQDEQEESI